MADNNNQGGNNNGAGNGPQRGQGIVIRFRGQAGDESVTYTNCRRNISMSPGRYAVDGCRLFQNHAPAVGDDNAMLCATCGCHRSFHRKVVLSHGRAPVSIFLNNVALFRPQPQPNPRQPPVAPQPPVMAPQPQPPAPQVPVMAPQPAEMPREVIAKTTDESEVEEAEEEEEDKEEQEEEEDEDEDEDDEEEEEEDDEEADDEFEEEETDEDVSEVDSGSEADVNRSKGKHN